MGMRPTLATEMVKEGDATAAGSVTTARSSQTCVLSRRGQDRLRPYAPDLCTVPMSCDLEERAEASKEKAASIQLPNNYLVNGAATKKKIIYKNEVGKRAPCRTGTNGGREYMMDSHRNSKRTPSHARAFMLQPPQGPGRRPLCTTWANRFARPVLFWPPLQHGAPPVEAAKCWLEQRPLQAVGAAQPPLLQARQPL